MKRTVFITLFSVVLFSLAFAVVDTLPITVRAAPVLILDVSCFYNDARVASSVGVKEIISETETREIKKIWTRDGRVSFRLAPGKSYRVSAINLEGEGQTPILGGPEASMEITNFQHSTAVGLTLEIKRREEPRPPSTIPR